MKKIILFITIILFCGCVEKKYEYKVVKVEPDNEYGAITMDVDPYPNSFKDQTQMLNKMASQGWELVDTYTEIMTRYPNFGNKEYVTGIRTNTKTSAINFIFKRVAKEKKE